MGYTAHPSNPPHPPIATLVHVLKTDKRARMRKWAAKELGLRGEPGAAEVVRALSEALANDASAEVRAAALAALVAVDTSAVSPPRPIGVDGLLRWLSQPSRNKYVRAAKQTLLVLLYVQLLATVLSPEVSFVLDALRAAYAFVARLSLGSGLGLLLVLVAGELLLLWLLWPAAWRRRPSAHHTAGRPVRVSSPGAGTHSLPPAGGATPRA